MECPDALQKAAIYRRLALFIGSGVSANATNKAHQHPPTWSELLRELSSLTPGNTRRDIARLIDNNQLLQAAELLRYSIRRDCKTIDFNAKLNTLVNGPKNDPFKPSEWHDTIDQLNPQIIITTNYDHLLEGNSSETYAVNTFSTQMIDNHVRIGATTILKIHGDANAAYNGNEDLILSISDYARARQKGRLAFDMIKAIFLTHTTLFLGYSMNDPDLQIILEDLFFDREVHSPHFLLTKSAQDYEIEYFKDCYGINVLQCDDYGLSFFKTLVEDSQASRPSTII